MENVRHTWSDFRSTPAKINEFKQRKEEANFPSEIKAHVVKEGANFDELKPGVVGKFVVSRSREKQAELDAKSHAQNASNSSEK